MKGVVIAAGPPDNPGESSGPQSRFAVEETGFHHIGQAGPELLTFSDPPTSASQSAEIADRVFHCYPGWGALVHSRLTANSASQVQAILLPEPPE
ncbi:putative uncharacterized protein SPANXA2-OT1 [Plecturocebus cupreus]